MRIPTVIKSAARRLRLRPPPVSTSLVSVSVSRKIRSRWFEFVSEHEIDRSVIIAGTFRGGTTFFGELLRPSVRNDGIVRELFAPLGTAWGVAPSLREEFLVSQLKSIAATAKEGVFATKLQWPHRNDLSRCLGISRGHSKQFRRLFPNATWFWVRRSDRFAQAVSFWRAKETSQWHRYEGSRVVSSPPYSFSGIDACYRELAAHDDLWRDFFEQSKITPIEISYEELMAGPGAYLTPRLPADLAVGGARIPAKVPLVRQADEFSVSYRARYLEQLYGLGR